MDRKAGRYPIQAVEIGLPSSLSGARGCASLEFEERPNKWEWLIKHFNTPEQKVDLLFSEFCWELYFFNQTCSITWLQAKCARLKKIRNETVRPRHHSGTVPFSYRSKAHELKGEPAPIIKTFEEVYQADPLAAPLVEEMNAKVKTIIDKLHEERGDIPDDEPVSVPVSTQLNVVFETLPQTRGTSISGVVGAIRRSPKKRGGARSSVASEEILRHKDEIRELKELVAQQSDRLSQQAELIKFFHEKLMAMEGTSGEGWKRKRAKRLT